MDLSIPYDRAKLTAMIRADIDTFSMTFDDGPRRHLGASLIGDPCDRFLWLNFHWMFKAEFEPRMLRLFQRGHREEDWLWAMLRACGWTILDVDPATGKQWRVSAVEGHFGGSLDAVGFPPAHYGIQEWMLIECKTNKSGENGKKWLELEKQGMVENKPKHWAQSCVYGALKGIRWAVYFNVNKDDDRLHVEPLELQPAVAAQAIKRAEFVILAQTSPAKLHPNTSFYECRYCDARKVCHEGAPTLRNCRSCHYSAPAANKQWYCNGYQQMLTDDIIATGCANWTERVH
jgi:hypothetical protein